ncbi:MAG: hypothetical protein SOT46_11210 [Treponema sp.]|nr:hypothetical protein [Spirochaetia bacterium]MDY2840924.1 hypothetical protein [Treponema sp.]
MSAKIIVLFILSLAAGIALLCSGFYFLSKRYISRLKEAAPDQEKETLKKNELRAKTSAYISFGLGAVTLVWAAFILIIPQIAPFLALVYMVFLLVSSAILIYIYK